MRESGSHLLRSRRRQLFDELSPKTLINLQHMNLVAIGVRAKLSRKCLKALQTLKFCGIHHALC